MNKYNYLKKFIDYTYHVKYNDIRELLHFDIIESYFFNKKPFKNNKIIFTGGCYGSGKGHVIKMLHNMKKINLDDYLYVDQDKIRQYIPEYAEYLKDNFFTAGFRTNKETAYLAELIQKHALFNNYNVIVDGSMRDGKWYIEHINWIKNTFPHYEIIILYVESSWVNILERNLKRGEQTKRCIPLECLRNAFVQSPISYEMLKTHVNKHYKIANDNEEEINELLKTLDI